MFFPHMVWDFSLPLLMFFVIFFFSYLKWTNAWKSTKQEAKMNKTLTTRGGLCIYCLKVTSFSVYSLVPTMCHWEHPLIVDEHPTTKVVSIVEGGHVWTRVRLTLLPANDPAIFAWNCRFGAQSNRQSVREKEWFVFNYNSVSNVNLCVSKCASVLVHVCVCVYQQLQPSAKKPAVSWFLVNDQRTPGYTPAHIYMLPVLLCIPPLPWSVDPICFPTLYSYLLALNVSAIYSLIRLLFSYLPISATSLWLCHLYTSFTNEESRSSHT